MGGFSFYELKSYFFLLGLDNIAVASLSLFLKASFSGSQ